MADVDVESAVAAFLADVVVVVVVRDFLLAREDGLVVFEKSEWEDSESLSGVGSARLRDEDAMAISLDDFMVGMVCSSILT